MTISRPDPLVDADHVPFWEGLRSGTFLLPRCRSCGTYYWPMSYCRGCEPEPLFGNMEWVPASGEGTVFAHNVHRLAFEPWLEGRVPFVYALIELAEGPLMASNIEGCEPDDVHPGMRVRVSYVPVSSTYTIPVFVPA